MTVSNRMRRLEEQKSAVLAEIGGWPEELRLWRPTDGGWSALEVLDHLVRTEVGICGAVAGRLAKPERIRVRDRVGFVFVERVLRSRRRVRVPDSVKEIILPGEGLEWWEMAARWDAARVELDRLVDAVEEAGCRGGVFRHPVGGWMTFEQVLRFFSVHMVHHEYQLERIRAGVPT
ncbi:MAG TPA: DinB family protein [Acidobacteriaceae bacterium]|nr:DinB family protein [Acidobacteriaceae bacterium]